MHVYMVTTNYCVLVNNLPIYYSMSTATFDQLLSAFVFRIIDWISNWADTMASPDLTANAAFALQMQSVMNIMHSNAQPFSIYKSSVTSMYHLNHNSSP